MVETTEIAEINLIYRRNLDGITSFYTVPIDIRRNWVTTALVRYMAGAVKELNNLIGWEFVCYYYNR
mgnify:CR=1 FL=1